MNGTMDLPNRIREIAAATPDKTALIHIHRSILGKNKVTRTTYRTLSDRAEATAVGLREIGVGPGTLCSFMVPPGEDALVLSLALWRIGAVIVGIEPHSHGLRRISPVLNPIRPEFFFGTPAAHLARAAFGWGGKSVKQSIVVGPNLIPGRKTLRSLERPIPAEIPTADVAPEDLALIAFTTGSTGRPKPTVMTQKNLVSMMDGVRALWRLDEGGEIIDMPTFPMFWIIGMSHGGTVVVPPMDFALKGPGDADPAMLVNVINDYKVSSMFASPALLTNLAAHCARTGDKLPSMRRIISGGAEIQGPLYAGVKAILPNGELYSNYGATEALPVAEIDGTTVVNETWPRTEKGEGVCVGTVLPGIDIRIIKIDDGNIASIEEAETLSPNQIGEVIVRSDHISDRYHESPKDMEENKIQDGDTKWHRLGDLGFLDESGRLWVCGRRSHRVETAERTWYPLNCEPVFNTHPDVARSALIGPAVGVDGAKVPMVVIELAPGAAARKEQIIADLAEIADKFDSTRGIARFIVIDKLPVDRRHNAKIDRPALARGVEDGSLR